MDTNSSWGKGRYRRRSTAGDVQAVCRGLIKEIQEGGCRLEAAVEDKPTCVRKLPNVEEFHDTDGKSYVHDAIAWDDITGMELDGKMVREARNAEMEYVSKKTSLGEYPRVQGAG